jgi:hypothetical protein
MRTDGFEILAIFVLILIHTVRITPYVFAPQNIP